MVSIVWLEIDITLGELTEESSSRVRRRKRLAMRRRFEKSTKSASTASVAFIRAPRLSRTN
jgi:hypothetical protein